MRFLYRNSVFIGSILLVCIITVLLLDINMIFTPGVTFIGTDLYRSSGNDVFVRTKMDFGNQEHMATLPLQIGEWQGWDYDITSEQERLKADVILLRGYTTQSIYIPIFLLIMQAQTESSFHHVDICYISQGYEIQEEGTEQVQIKDVSWTAASHTEYIPFNKLVVIKKQDGRITERRVVLYCYVKGNQFTSDTITLIRTEVLAPISGSYEGILDVAKDFTALTVPLMFEPGESARWKPIAMELWESGTVGRVGLVLLILLPLAIVFLLKISRYGRR